MALESLQRNVKTNEIKKIIDYMKDKKIEFFDPTLQDLVDSLHLLNGTCQYCTVITGLTSVNFLYTRANLIPFRNVPSKFVKNDN